ncbi:MAG: NfeD family protein [Gammaproteobacteria bacterium]|nr:NfeD family protein [Gammaproteobacteria bacterium]
MEFVLEFWHWWALALIFVVVEALLLSGAFAAFAAAGLIAGSALYFYPELDWKLQLVIFATSTAILFFLIRVLFSDWLNQNAEDNASTSEMIGKEFVLKLPIQNGFGEIEIDGKNWAIKGADQKTGTTVKVIGVDSYFLSVYPIGINKTTQQATD